MLFSSKFTFAGTESAFCAFPIIVKQEIKAISNNLQLIMGLFFVVIMIYVSKLTCLVLANEI